MKLNILAGLIIVIYSCFGTLLNAQDDERAGRILDEFSGQILSAPSLSIDFTIIMSRLRDDTIEEFDGQLTMKGDKYRLNVMDMESWFDGTSVYTLMKDVNEVIISDPDEQEGLMSNPVKLFTLYDEEFKYKLIGETNQEGARLYEIDLHPVELDHNFHTVKLFIYRDKYFLHSAVIAGKDGNRYTFLVNYYDNTVHLTDSFFRFDENDHPGVEVIDMRW